MLVYGLVRLRKRRLGGDVTDWCQTEQLAGLGPELVVLLVADRVGGVMRRLGSGRVVPAGAPSCRGSRQWWASAKSILAKIKKIHEKKDEKKDDVLE